MKNHKISLYIKNIIIWPLGIIVFLVGSLFAILAYPIDRMLNLPGDSVHIVSRYFGRTMLWLCGIEVKVDGLENIYRDRAQLICANHQSLFDIFILDSILPVQFRFVVKKELHSLPILGLCIRIERQICLDRKNVRKGIESMKQAGKLISQGRSVAIFPEGTRSKDGNVKKFKKGSFLIATASNAPVVPVTIDGSFHIMPKNSFLIHPDSVSVKIGLPIETEGLSRAEQKQLSEKVRGIITDGLECSSKSFL